MKALIIILISLIVILGIVWTVLGVIQVSTQTQEIIPGVNTSIYQNSQFSIGYPGGSQISTSGYEGYLPVTQSLSVGILLDTSLFQGTNLGEAGLFIGTSSQTDKCLAAQTDLGEIDMGIAVINGQQFRVFQSTGVGAGNIYEFKIYRTLRNGNCYEIVEILHSGNIGNYPTDTVVQFDKVKFSGYLEKIANTLIFN